MSKPFYNIIFCIFGCDTIEKYKKEILKVKETWGKATQSPTGKATQSPTEKDHSWPTDKATPLDKAQNHFLFFLGEEGPFTGDEYIHLENVENDYLSASYKQYGGLKYIYEKYNFNYVYICGTDTYVLTDNLENYISQNSQISPDKPLVIGGHGDNRQICGLMVHFFARGAGIILTKATMDIIYPELHTMQEEWLWMCVENDYNTYIAACDLSLCYFLKRRGIMFLNVPQPFFRLQLYGILSQLMCMLCKNSRYFNNDKLP